MINMKNKLISLCLATWFLSTSHYAFALKGDTNQPIDVLSENQSLNMDQSMATFTKNVIIKQGSILIHADKVVVIRPQKSSTKKETIDAYGFPVYFEQKLDNGKLVKGKANKVHYDLANELITLTHKAELSQQDSKINGRYITYDVKKQQLKANGSKGKRVRTILIPAQLESSEKNVINHSVEKQG